MTLIERDAGVMPQINSSTLENSAAMCADCKTWEPRRRMFWDGRNLCSGCKERLEN